MAGIPLIPYDETAEKEPKVVKVDYSIDIKDILAEVEHGYSSEAATPPPVEKTSVTPSSVVTPPPEKPAPTPVPASETSPNTMELDQALVLEMLSQMQRLTREVEQLRAEVSAASAHPALEKNAGKRVETVPKSRVKASKEKKAQSKASSILGNVVFYAMLVALVLGAFLLKSHSSGAPFTFAGHAAFTVLTSSMEDTYPKGSLVVTKAVDAKELQIGDDITFMISQNASVTHRIVGVIENYQNTGQRAFETQGTMNKDPDKDPAIAANVVGKVIFCSVILGQAAAFITKNWPFMLFLMVVLFALIAFLKWNMNRPDETGGKKAKRAASPQEAAANSPIEVAFGDEMVENK